MDVNVNKSSSSRVRIVKRRTIDKVDRRGEKDKDGETIRGRRGGAEGALVGGYN